MCIPHQKPTGGQEQECWEDRTPHRASCIVGAVLVPIERHGPWSLSPPSSSVAGAVPRGILVVLSPAWWNMGVPFQGSCTVKASWCVSVCVSVLNCIIHSLHEGYVYPYGLLKVTLSIPGCILCRAGRAAYRTRLKNELGGVSNECVIFGTFGSNTSLLPIRTFSQSYQLIHTRLRVYS
jgi:hypothetical protein